LKNKKFRGLKLKKYKNKKLEIKLNYFFIFLEKPWGLGARDSQASYYLHPCMSSSIYYLALNIE